jgi:putative FmdB family regulatory protein
VPIYEYRCSDCGAVFEVVQKFSDDPVEVCERCSGPVTKVLHPVAIHFKGSGFYTTDYGRGKKTPRPSASETGDKRPVDEKPASGDKGAGASGAKDGTSGGGGPSGAASKVKGTSS